MIDNKPRQLSTGQTDGYFETIPEGEPAEQKKYGFFETFAAYVARDNFLPNAIWKASDTVLTKLEQMDFEKVDGYDPLSEEERSKYDPKYWPLLSTAKTPLQAARKVYKAEQEEHLTKIIENGTTWGAIAGGFYNAPTSPATYLPVMKAVQTPKFFASMGLNAVRTVPGIVLGVGAEEVGLQYAQESRKLEESFNNIVGAAAGGLLFGAAGAGISHAWNSAMNKAVKETIKGAEVKTNINAKGELAGLEIHEGGSMGAAKVENIPLTEEDLKLKGTKYKFLPGSMAAYFGAQVLRNPVLQGLLSRSKTTRSFANSMMENNYEIENLLDKSWVRPVSLQTKINQYSALGTKYQLDSIKFYEKQLGLDESGNKIGNAVKSAFVSEKDGYIPVEDFMHKASLAITRGGLDQDFPIVQDFANYTIREILEPNDRALNELNILPNNFVPFGASRHLQRVYDKNAILADKPNKIKALAAEYGIVNHKIQQIMAPIDKLHEQKGRLQREKAASKSDKFDKDIAKVDKQIKNANKKIEEDILKGKYGPEMLVGDRGMSWDQIQQLKKLRKPIKEAKKAVRHAEEELNVYKRKVNKGRRAFEPNLPADEHQIGLEDVLAKAKEKLKTMREDLSNRVKNGELDESLFFKTSKDNFRLKKPNFGTLKLRPILTEEQLTIAAEQCIDNITGMSEDQIIESLMQTFKSGSSGSIESVMNPRTNLVSDEFLYNNGFMVTDLRKTIPAFLTRMGRLIETEKYFREKGYQPGKTGKMDFIADGIKRDYKELEEALESEISKKLENAKTDKAREKIEKKAGKERVKLAAALEHDKDLCAKIFARVTGQVPMQNGALLRSFRTLNNWAYASNLGLLVATMLGESVSPAIKTGLVPFTRDIVQPFLRSIIQRKGHKKLVESVADMNIAFETELAFNNIRYGQGLEYHELPMGKAESVTKQAANIMGLINFSSLLSDKNKKWATIGLRSNLYRKMLEFSKGTLKGNDLERFKVLGLNDLDFVNRCIKEFNREGVGEMVNGAYLPNFHLWNDAAAALRFQTAIRQEVESVMFSGKNIASYPIDVDFHGFANSFLMFMGWGFQAWANYTVPFLQRFDFNKVQGFGMVLMLSMLQEPLRKVLKGEEVTEEDLKPETLIKKGFFNSGLGGFPVELFNKVNAAYDIFPDLQVDRFKNKGTLQLFGAPFGMIDLLGSLAGQTWNWAWNKKELKRNKNNIPLAGSILFRKLGDEFIDSLDIPETRAQAKKEKQREEGKLPEKKPKQRSKQ